MFSHFLFTELGKNEKLLTIKLCRKKVFQKFERTAYDMYLNSRIMPTYNLDFNRISRWIFPSPKIGIKHTVDQNLFPRINVDFVFYALSAFPRWSLNSPWPHILASQSLFEWKTEREREKERKRRDLLSTIVSLLRDCESIR